MFHEESHKYIHKHTIIIELSLFSQLDLCVCVCVCTNKLRTANIVTQLQTAYVGKMWQNKNAARTTNQIVATAIAAAAAAISKQMSGLYDTQIQLARELSSLNVHTYTYSTYVLLF